VPNRKIRYAWPGWGITKNNQSEPSIFKWPRFPTNGKLPFNFA
jgi:hypothetical protein